MYTALATGRGWVVKLPRTGSSELHTRLIPLTMQHGGLGQMSVRYPGVKVNPSPEPPRLPAVQARAWRWPRLRRRRALRGLGQTETETAAARAARTRTALIWGGALVAVGLVGAIAFTPRSAWAF